MTGDTVSVLLMTLVAGQKVTDAYPLYDACEKDNIYVLNANFVGEFNEGALKCDPADCKHPNNLVTRVDNTILNISINHQGLSIGQDFDILQLYASTMKLKNTFVSWRYLYQYPNFCP